MVQWDIEVGQKAPSWGVKAKSDRASIRMAIGQLADYLRYLPEDLEAGIVLPENPSQDLVRLVDSQGFRLVVEEDGVLFEL